MLVTLYENVSTLAEQRSPVASVRASDVVEITAVRKPADLNYQTPRQVTGPEELWLHRDEETGEVWREEFEVHMASGKTYLCRFLFPREAGPRRRALIAAINGDQRHKEQQDQLLLLSTAVGRLADAIDSLSKRVSESSLERRE